MLIVDAQVHIWTSGTPVHVLLAPNRASAVSAIAAKHPKLKIDDLVALAKHPNVAIKETGAPSYSIAPITMFAE